MAEPIRNENDLPDEALFAMWEEGSPVAIQPSISFAERARAWNRPAVSQRSSGRALVTVNFDQAHVQSREQRVAKGRTQGCVGSETGTTDHLVTV